MQNIILLKELSFILIVFVWKSINVIPGFWKNWYYQIVRENIHIAEDGRHKLMNNYFSIWENAQKLYLLIGTFTVCIVRD